MKNIFKIVMILLVLISFLALPQLSLAEKYTSEVEVKKEEKNKKETAKKEKETIEMEEVVVTATRTETPVENLPQNVTIIKAEDIERMHVKTVDDVLQKEPGIEIIRSYGLGYSGWVIMRGVGDKKRTLILKDGIPLNDMQYGGFSDWNKISAGDIERIEIIRGASSSLYGSSAMGGAINIITKEPTEKLEGDLNYTYGSQNTHLHNFNIRGKTNDWLGFRLSAGGKNNDGYKNIEPWKEYYDKTTMDEYNISPGVDIKLGKSKLALQYEYLDEETVFTSYSTYDSDRYINKYTLDYKIPIGKADCSAKLYYFDRNSKTDSNMWNSATKAHDKPYYTRSVPEDDYGALIQASREILGQRFTAGYDLKWGELDSDTYYAGKGLRHYSGKQQQHSVFLNGEFFWGEKTVFNLGLRYDWWKNFDGNFHDDTTGNVIKTDFKDRTDTHWSPSAGVVYHLNQDIRLRTSVGTGFLAPSLYELYSNSIYGTTLYAGNPDLDPEKMTYSADCGFDVKFPKNVNFSLTCYRSEIKDYIDSVTVGLEELPPFIDPKTVDQIRMKKNIGKVKIYGLEAMVGTSFSALYGEWNMSANYTYNKSEIESCKDPTLEGKLLPYNAPQHMATFKLNYENPILFTIDLSLRYRGHVFCDSQNTDKKKKPAYTVGDLKISRQLPWLTGASAFLSINNFTDKRYKQCPQCPDYIMPGRMYFVGMKYTF